jgi:hypothetical protein
MTFELIAGTWTERRTLTANLALRYSIYIPDSSSALVIAGRKLREVSYADWMLIKLRPDMYLVVNNEAPAVRPFPQQLREAPIEEASSFVHIWVYCPDISNFPNEDAETRLRRLGQALRRASEIKADIFLGPEYFFSRFSSALETPAVANQTYTQAEKERVETALGEAARANRGMLIIPGTMLWKDSANLVRNTAFINCRLNGIRHAHSKHKAHNDIQYALAAGGTWAPGDTHFDFDYRGWSVRFQICADNSNDADGPAPKELHILSGFDFGAYNPRAHRGGWEVVCDGKGWGRIEQAGTTFKPATVPDGENFSVVVDIHKLKTT